MRILASVLLLVLGNLIEYSFQQVQVNPNMDPSQVRVEEARPPGHRHAGHGGFNRDSVHDREHIKEHLKEVVDKPKEEMTEEELEFHYFKLHDYDGNNKLDGVEIGKALTHYHKEEEGDDPNVDHQVKAFTDDEISSIVDLVLKEDDLNGDGYIEYPEFVTAQRRSRDDTQEEP
ncbi:hypothetical protein ScPMuIL_014023 [Solemya velum]